MFCIARRPYCEPTASHHCGDMNIVCSSCGALHWIDERVSSSSKFSLKFSMCCAQGKVVVQLLPDPPPVLRQLYISQSTQAQDFRSNIVLYNRALAFTSLGVEQDYSVLDGRGPPVFRIHGELKHLSGSLIPDAGKPVKYAQLYIYDPDTAMKF